MAATLRMTATMRRLHANLPAAQQHPLPPREITERVMGAAGEDVLPDASLAAHFGYGALAGGLLAAGGTRPSLGAGALMGVGVWAASYFGWAPALGILKPAHRHDPRRNALMLGAHLVWGAALAWGMRELTDARETMLASGPLKDAPSGSGKGMNHGR